MENAIHYGVAARSDQSLIEISAQGAGARLILTVRDNGPGLPQLGYEPDAGIGISNTRERLRCLYADNQSFSISSGVTGSGVLVKLTLPFQSTDSLVPRTSHDQFALL